jgi:predicted kinase
LSTSHAKCTVCGYESSTKKMSFVAFLQHNFPSAARGSATVIKTQRAAPVPVVAPVVTQPAPAPASRGTCYIMRGIPGCGKSTLARQLIDAKVASAKATALTAPAAPMAWADIKDDDEEDAKTGVICSTDDYFINAEGVYVWTEGNLHNNHVRNQDRADALMKEGVYRSVVIDNVNAKAGDMQPYVLSARKHGYDVKFVYVKTAWANNVSECHRRCTHNVPLEAIEKAAKNFLPKSVCTVKIILAWKPYR